MVDAPRSAIFEPATKGDLFDLAEIVSDVTVTVLEYMIADWSRPDEAKKKEAIDELLLRLNDLNALRNTLLGKPNDVEDPE